MKVCGDSKVTYQGVEIDFKRPFRRLRMVDAIKETTGLDCETLKTYEEAKAAALKLGGVDSDSL